MKRFFKAVIVFAVTILALTGCSSDEEKLAGYLEKGNAYFEKGEYSSAEIEFKNAAKIDPKNVNAHIKLG